MSILSDRALGQYPVSIATSLAIEALAGIYEDRPEYPAPILKFGELWINLRTLYRNLMGALSKEGQAQVLPNDLAPALLDEMDMIVSIVREISEDKTGVVFYYSNYVGMETKYPQAVLRRDNTERQKEYTILHNKTVELILKTHPERIQGFNLKLKPKQRSNAVILTHMAYDLLSHREFKELTLVESHTGHIKKMPQWYTKYYNGKELSMMPFREDLLQVFGDAETFRPMDIRLRRDLIEIATHYRWTSVTTTEKIRYGVNALKNPYSREILLKMLVH